jgi:uroporphyrinogen-III synthase
VGKRIVITRAAHQAEELATLLRQAGAQPLFYPCIDIIPPEDIAPLDSAIMSVQEYDWLVLTSANTVHALAARLDALGLPPSILNHLQTAAVGPATAKSAREMLGLDSILPSNLDTQTAVPVQSHHPENASDDYSAVSLAERLRLAQDARVLLPQSEIASPALAESLARQGAVVQVVTAYRTARSSGGDPIPHLLALGEVDAIIFTSGSTIDHFLGRLAAEAGKRDDLAGVAIACMGTSTVQAARAAGLSVAVVPPVSTLTALIRSLEDYFDATQ